MPLITTTAALAAFCDAHRDAEFITVDTEFMRERTYWPKLCLVQLGGPEQAVAVDPLAEGISLEPLFDLLADPKILKVFHAARQDVEIFVNLTGKVPTPLFDSQVVASVCGHGDSVSYETLAATLAKAKVDKSSRFTDWSHRPLTDKQVTYALGDVIHLRTIYEKLSHQMAKLGRASWVQEDMAILTDLATYQIEPREVWRKFKWRADKPRLRALLRELAAWRENEAQRQNVPRSRVLRDEAILEIANHAPRDAQELARTRGLSTGLAEGKVGAALLAAVERGNAVPLADCPAGDPHRKIAEGVGPVTDLLKILLKQVSEKEGVAARLIANTDALEAIAADDNADVPALHGWRRTLFGAQALDLKHGKIALSVKNNRVAVMPTDG